MIPELLIVSQSLPGSLTDLVKTIAAVVALPIALGTFWVGYRQKDRERMLSYYHSAVVDISLPLIMDFFDSQLPLVDGAGRVAIEGVASSEKAVPKQSISTLASFSTGLFNLKDSITQRTVIFDEEITPQIELEFEAIQDHASEWFNDVAQFKRREIPELAAILRRGQRLVVRRLYQGRFRDPDKWWKRTRQPK
jgi:hypothetical protein